MTRRQFMAGLGVLLVAVSGCGTNPPAATSARLQLIVKPANAPLDEGRIPAWLARVGGDTGFALNLAGRMGGGLLLVDVTAPEVDANSVIERLSAHPDIEWVEINRRVRRP